MTDETKTLLTFPCELNIKVMGKTGDEFEKEVLGIFAQHIPNMTEGAIKFKHSSGGKYTSINVIFEAKSKPQVDAIYIDLTASKHVVMAL